MAGVYKEVRELRAKVRAARRAVGEAQTLLATWRDSCEDFLRAHATLAKLPDDLPGSPSQLTKAALEDKRRVQTILAEVNRLEADLAALLAPRS
jgi:hypothetical protein